jgi:hypothetical protein
MLQRSSHTPTQEIKQTPSSPRKQVKVAWSRGLVKISASWSCVGTWIKVIFRFSTLSLGKWYLTSMCLVLEWSTGFFATLMALVLSHWSGTWVYSSPKSLMVREDQDTKEDPKNWQVLEVDFLSNRHPTKSTSEKPWSAKEEDAEYQRPIWSVTQVPENLLHCLPMRSPRRRLKMSAQTYRELDVRPHRYQVKEWPDHASVLLLVHVFTFLIRIKSCNRTHRRRHSLGVLHLELPHNVLGVLSLVHKCSFLWLLDL